MKEAFIEKRFNKSSVELIEVADQIIDEYIDRGIDLTLRQLYYQFVQRNVIPNTQKEYKRLGSIINDARLAGHIDWDAIEDRTRNLTNWRKYSTPSQAVEEVVNGFRLDKWEHQPRMVEVWVEKEALSSVVEIACGAFQVPYFCCRGYVSQSEMYNAANRIAGYCRDVVVIHLGDHDPSGIDMTRDIEDRLEIFNVWDVEIRRIALNYNQIEELQPPPNPAKMTDSRFSGYQAKYGESSWELDALNPDYMINIIQDEIKTELDVEIWDEDVAREKEGKKMLVDAKDEINKSWGI